MVRSLRWVNFLTHTLYRVALLIPLYKVYYTGVASQGRGVRALGICGSPAPGARSIVRLTANSVEFGARRRDALVPLSFVVRCVRILRIINCCVVNIILDVQQ